MRKHGGTSSLQDKCVTLAAISPPGVARGRFVGGHQSGLAGCKSPPLFKRRASSCSLQQQSQREPWCASRRSSAPTYLPLVFLTSAKALLPRLAPQFVLCPAIGAKHGDEKFGRLRVVLFNLPSPIPLSLALTFATTTTPTATTTTTTVAVALSLSSCLLKGHKALLT